MKNLTLLLFLVAQASAQKLTLPDAIAIALQKNFAIQIAQNDAEISRINNHLGIAGGLPSVTAAASDQQNASNINQKFSNGTEIAPTARGGQHPERQCHRHDDALRRPPRPGDQISGSANAKNKANCSWPPKSKTPWPGSKPAISGSFDSSGTSRRCRKAFD